MKPLFTPSSLHKQVIVNDTNIPAVTKSQMMEGLTPTEMQRIRTLKGQLSTLNHQSLLDYGKDVQQEGVSLADEVVGVATVADAAGLGDTMTKVLQITQGVQLGTLKEKSRIPLLGGIIDRAKNVKAKVTDRYTLARDRIQELLTEAAEIEAKMASNIGMLEKLYDANRKEYRELQLHSFAAKARYEEITAETDAFEKSLKEDCDPFDRQQVADARRYLSNLKMTIANFEMLTLSALETSQAIRQAQSNSALILDKYGMLKKFTFPSWKKQFALALLGNDNLQAANVANAVDDANNELARKNATMLRMSSVAAAKVSQRGVYDLETLEFVHKEFQTQAQEVKQIQLEGDQKRTALIQRVQQMKLELQSTMTKEVTK